jgi:hypothetical protein
MSSRKYNVILGQKINSLTVLEELYLYKNNRNERYVRCLCDCGKETILRIVSLLNNTKSCGCLRIAKLSEKITTHGCYESTIYNVWTGMKNRCYHKNSKYYKYYGGRGISIHQDWIDNPELFFKWALANGYKKGLTIERINNNSNYSPFNCKFISRLRQANNMRSNIIIDYNNTKLTMSDFCRKYNLRYQRFHDRIVRLNWAVEKAMVDCSIA